MVTPKFLALVFSVRIRMPQQQSPRGVTGSRDGLKIRSRFWGAGSIPAVGTKANAKRPGAFPETINTLFYEYRKI